jgi:hypothetical protein
MGHFPSLGAPRDVNADSGTYVGHERALDERTVPSAALCPSRERAEDGNRLP